MKDSEIRDLGVLRERLLGIHKGGDDPMEMVGHKLDIDGMENFIQKFSLSVIFYFIQIEHPDN